MESRRVFSVFNIPATLSSVTAWWEIALLSGARIPEVDPTVHPVKRKIQELLLEQTNDHMKIPTVAAILADKEVEITDLCETCKSISQTTKECFSTLRRRKPVLPN